ncbi:MAG: glycine cleavage system protein H, partial [Holdemania filiformis]
VETLPDGTVKIGISDYAQDSLGDIVFVDMHPAGEEVEAEGALADVESVKAVSEIYSPVAGTIKETNEELIDAPEKLNEDCYGNWICVMENVGGLDDLLSPEAYSEYLTTLE